MIHYIQLFNTVKFLKLKQIYYRLYYLARAKFRKTLGQTYPLTKKPMQTKKLNFEISIKPDISYLGNSKFLFLNQLFYFDNEMDWNYNGYGKLWTYNLNYFDFLNQGFHSEYIRLIEDFIDKTEIVGAGMESYPISLRGINWIKFLSKNGINNAKIDESLYAQYAILYDNLEFHLLGNHLLENAFSLLFGAYYFEDTRLYKKAKEILIEELVEQVLNDGAHFELSPMYHQIILFRILESINLIRHNQWREEDLLNILIGKAELMLGWLKQITYNDGTVPLLNDSANKIAPSSVELFDYAERLSITTKKKKLSESGYRKFVTKNYELVIDIGNIGPDYIPGHAHSDTFSFELRRTGKAFIVDTGLSTYESNQRRTIERSTASHNTVQVGDKEQSEVWGGFRVANRAKVIDVQEESECIKATHNGYRAEGIYHTRQWLHRNDYILIEDTLSQETDATARIHFHPDISLDDIENSIEVLSGHVYSVCEYTYAPEFNREVKALMLEFKFTQSLAIKIHV